MIVTASARRMSRPTAPDPVVLIRSSAYASLPAPGNRIDPSDASNMPTIRSSSAAGTPAILTADGAHHYRLVGLNIESHASGSNTGVVNIGGNGETTLAEYASDITIDRCIVKGAASGGTRRGVLLDGIRSALIDSYVYDIKENDFDTQAVWAYNTPGPIKIANNFLEATGENLLIGGGQPLITDQNPSDIEIRRNHIKKPTSWIGAGWIVKNLVEFKLGVRVLCEGNVLENNWEASQNGFAWLVTPRNEFGTAPWSATQDLTFRYNKFLNCAQGFNLSGRDGNFGPDSSQITSRMLIEHNVLEISAIDNSGTNTASGQVFQFTNGLYDTTIRHNTSFHTEGGGSYALTDSTPDCDVFVFKDNIGTSGVYGWYGSGTAAGTATLTTYFTNYTFTNNAIIGGSGTYPANTWFPADTAAVGFVNYAGGDYSLDPSSSYYAGAANDATDGTNLGADIAALNTKIANTVTGAWNDQAVYTDHTYESAELPRSYIDTTYANQTGTTHVCTTAAEFTTALANCAIGDIIELTAGTTFTGSFTLRDI